MRVIRIGRTNETAPQDGPQSILRHHPPNSFGVDLLAMTFEFVLNAPITIARELRLNRFDLVAQLRIATLSIGNIRLGLIVERAGSQSRHFEPFRN